METDLSEQKTKIVGWLLAGESVLLSGRAGTGKTTLIREIIDAIGEKDDGIIGVCALTGIASLSICPEATTLHSLFGIGFADTFEEMKKISTFKHRRIKELKYVIIDEVSMMDGRFFEELDKYLKYVMNNNEFFGGIAVLFVGDFCQLPPVKDTLKLFKSNLFLENVKHRIELTHVFRQDEAPFLKILTEFRFGKLSRETIDVLKTRQWKGDSKIIPTTLYPTNDNVDALNQKELDKLKSDLVIFRAIDTENGVMMDMDNKIFDKVTLVPKELQLKIGAQVVHLKNTPGLRNGSRGIVESFKDGLPVVMFDDGVSCVIESSKTEIIHNKGRRDEIVYCRKQIPLKLAWALSIHKSQGMTLDKVIVSFKRAFADSQMYVAISRVRTLGGLYIEDLNPRLVHTNDEVLLFYAQFDPETMAFCRENGIVRKRKRDQYTHTK